MPHWIGDLVMATAFLQELRAFFPYAKITAMVASPLQDLLKNEAYIDEILFFDKKKSAFLKKGFFDLVKKLQERHFDLAILLTNSFSSAHLFWQARIPIRIGFRKDFRSLFLTHPISFCSQKMHQVDLYKKLLEPMQGSLQAFSPRLTVSLEQKNKVSQFLEKEGYGKKSYLIAVNPTAAYGSAKCWPKERYRQLILELSQVACVVVLGDLKSYSLVSEICEKMPYNVINLAGKTDLAELVAWIQRADLLITNDSGPMHIRNAVGGRLIALFGSTDDQVTGPYLQDEAVISKRVSCSPCFLRTCPIDFRCMKQIEVEEVLQKVLDVSKL